jgi:hypothetical protein
MKEVLHRQGCGYNQGILSISALIGIHMKFNGGGGALKTLHAACSATLPIAYKNISRYC